MPGKPRPSSRKATTKSARSSSGTRISKLLKGLLALALIKLAVIGLYLAGVDPVSALIGRITGDSTFVVAEAQAQQAPAQQAKPEEKKPEAKADQKKADAKGEEKKADAKAAEAKPAQPPADWNTLVQKQEELARREQSLKILEQELNTRLEQISKLDQEIKSMLEEAKAVKDEKFKHLVDVYANMKAKNAADALDKLDEKTAVKILAGMRGRQAGEILNFVPAHKAAKLSEALTKMRNNFV